jgi:hypothetical protein
MSSRRGLYEVANVPPDDGRLAGWLTAVKGLTVSNVLVIGMLVVIAIPAYLIYRALNDEALLDRFLSHYSEIGTDTSCTLREVRQRGGPDTWGLSTGFAYFGNDRWTVAVILSHQPTPEEIASHCEVLNLTVDWMRDPAEHEVPKIPKTNKPLIWQYPLDDKGFHPDADR